MRNLIITLTLIAIFSFSKQALASCEDAYRREIAKARLFNNKSGYQKMLSILKEVEGGQFFSTAQSYQLYLQIKKKNKGYSYTALQKFIRLANLANLFCEREKPLKFNDVKKWLLSNEALLAFSKSATVYFEISNQEIQDFIDLHKDLPLEKIWNIRNGLAPSADKKAIPATEKWKNPSSVLKKPYFLDNSLAGLLKPIKKNEKNLFNNDFVVAYHSIPDTSFQPSLFIYSLNAWVAELLYGIKVPLLPRIIKADFAVLPDLSAMPTGFFSDIFDKIKNDHNPKWIAVGVSASPSLYSNNEAPPYQVFQYGYTGGGGTKEAAVSIVMRLLRDLQINNTDLPAQIVETGNEIFRGLGGSILQIAIHQSVVQKYMFLSEAYGNNPIMNDQFASLYRNASYNTKLQSRVIMNPMVFLNPEAGKIYHYAWKQDLFNKKNSQFRSHLDVVLKPAILDCLKSVTCKDELVRNLISPEIVESLKATE